MIVIWKWRAVQWVDRDGKLTNSWDVMSGECERIVADLTEREAYSIVDAHNAIVEAIIQLAY